MSGVAVFTAMQVDGVISERYLLQRIEVTLAVAADMLAPFDMIFGDSDDD